jgi:hypothetical protein
MRSAGFFFVSTGSAILKRQHDRKRQGLACGMTALGGKPTISCCVSDVAITALSLFFEAEVLAKQRR